MLPADPGAIGERGLVVSVQRRVRLVAVVVLVAVLAGGLALQVGSEGWPDRWLARLGVREPKVSKPGRFAPPPPSAGVPMDPGAAPAAPGGPSVEEWFGARSEEVRQRVGAEPLERVLSPSTRLVRQSSGGYVFEDAGKALWRPDGGGGFEKVDLTPQLKRKGPVAAVYAGTGVATSFRA